MLSKDNFSKEHIDELRARYKRDPALLERTIYAFGMLEAITQVNLPFIFKGGTCLMLLLNNPARLSTDIDIIVKPGTDISEYVEAASKIFPFTDYEEQVRKGKNNIEKRHFKFTYVSPVTNREIYILLDVLFEENNYARLIKKEIKNDLLITEGEKTEVTIPDLNCILGDKLTAFAPHTTGIPLGVGKDVEVLKQMYDVASLIQEMNDFELVKETYSKTLKTEIAYRGEELTEKDCLIDTIRTAQSIASHGKLNGDEYMNLQEGARGLGSFIFSENFNPEVAAKRAPIVMYFASCLLEGESFEKYDGEQQALRTCTHTEFKAFNFLRKLSPEAYYYICKTDEILKTI